MIETPEPRSGLVAESVKNGVAGGVVVGDAGLVQYGSAVCVA